MSLRAMTKADTPSALAISVGEATDFLIWVGDFLDGMAFPGNALPRRPASLGRPRYGSRRRFGIPIQGEGATYRRRCNAYDKDPGGGGCRPLRCEQHEDPASARRDP